MHMFLRFGNNIIQILYSKPASISFFQIIYIIIIIQNPDQRSKNLHIFLPQAMTVYANHDISIIIILTNKKRRNCTCFHFISFNGKIRLQKSH